MKKFLKAATLAAAVLTLTACGDEKEDDNTIVIGAAAGIHDIILEKAADILEEDGIGKTADGIESACR